MQQGFAVRRRFVLVLGCLTGLAAVSIDMSLPAIPALATGLETTLSNGQRIVGLFMAGIAIGQLPAGLLSDRIGRLPVLYAGVGLFTIAGVACTLSRSIELLLLARFVQGVGASAGIVLSRAIVRDIASGEQAARLLSIMVTILTAAPMLAPMLGGFLVTQWNWRLPFAAITVFGVLVLLGINASLRETHVPVREHHFLKQLTLSVREFFSHWHSVLGVLLVLLPSAGFMALITASSALVIEIYGFPVAWFGPLFALAGLGVLMGSTLNRRLLLHFHTVQVVGLGTSLIGIAALQLLVMAWLGEANFWWLWTNVCLYMFGVGFLLPNATALALDPVPKIAGVASSLIGTIQTIASASGSLASSAIYDGTIRNVVIIMGVFGVATSATFFAGRRKLGGHPQPDDVARG